MTSSTYQFQPIPSLPTNPTAFRSSTPRPDQQPSESHSRAGRLIQNEYINPNSNGHHLNGSSLVFAAQSAATTTTDQLITNPYPPLPNPPPALVSAPFHSYPHLHFRLPATLIDQIMNGECQPPYNSPSPLSGDSTSPLTPALTSAVAAQLSPTSLTPLKLGDEAPFYSTRYHVSFRAMHRIDVASVAALHDILFPVKYDERFYLDCLLPDRVTILAFLELNELPPPNESGLSMAPEPLLIGVATARVGERNGQCRRSYSGYINTLGIEPRFRRLGLGKFLLKHLIRMIREQDNRCSSIGLHVLASNDHAIKLYKSVGFQLDESLPDHYQFDGAQHDAFKLVKYIDIKSDIYEEIEEEIKRRSWCTIM